MSCKYQSRLINIQGMIRAGDLLAEATNSLLIEQSRTNFEDLITHLTLMITVFGLM